MLVSLSGHDCRAQSECLPVTIFPDWWPLAFSSFLFLFVIFGPPSHVGHILSFAFMIDCAVVAPEAFLLAPAVVACHSLSLSIDRGSGVTAPTPQYTDFLPCYVHSG